MARAAEHIIQVASPPDNVVLQIARSMFGAKIIDRCKVTIGPHTIRSASNAAELDEISNELKDLSGKRILKLNFQTPESFTVEFQRAITEGDATNPSTLLAEFYFNPQARNPDRAAAMAEIISNATSQPIAQLTFGSKQMESAMATHVLSLSNTATEISKKLAIAQTEYDTKLLAHKEQLDLQAEEADRRRQQQHDEMLSELKHKQLELDAKREELDTRRARDARRKLREDITEQLRTRLKRPQPSLLVQAYRALIIVLSSSGAIASTVYAFNSLGAIPLLELSTPPATMISVYGKVLASSALATVLIFYVLGYIRKLSSDDTKFERELEMFSLDIDRASWIIETVMEFREDEDGQTIPITWLEGATANLFSSNLQAQSKEDDAINALAEILRTGAQLKIGSNGAELTLDKSASKKVGRQTS